MTLDQKHLEYFLKFRKLLAFERKDKKIKQFPHTTVQNSAQAGLGLLAQITCLLLNNSDSV